MLCMICPWWWLSAASELDPSQQQSLLTSRSSSSSSSANTNHDSTSSKPPAPAAHARVKSYGCITPRLPCCGHRQVRTAQQWHLCSLQCGVAVLPFLSLQWSVAAAACIACSRFLRQQQQDCGRHSLRQGAGAVTGVRQQQSVASAAGNTVSPSSSRDLRHISLGLAARAPCTTGWLVLQQLGQQGGLACTGPAVHTDAYCWASTGLMVWDGPWHSAPGSARVPAQVTDC